MPNDNVGDDTHCLEIENKRMSQILLNHGLHQTLLPWDAPGRSQYLGKVGLGGPHIIVGVNSKDVDLILHNSLYRVENMLVLTGDRTNFVDTHTEKVSDESWRHEFVQEQMRDSAMREDGQSENRSAHDPRKALECPGHDVSTRLNHWS